MNIESVKISDLMPWTIKLGDCLEVLRTLEANSLDSLVTDPPAGISFMGKAWDDDKGGRDHWIAWLTEVMRECYRVLKPGAHGVVWALPRTSHWTATALENAGFEIRDVVTHLFGTGFPKSLDISKAIDKAAGAEREVVGDMPWTGAKMDAGQGVSGLRQSGGFAGDYDGERAQLKVTAPATDDAKRFQGWGTALKPSSEWWFLVQKPANANPEMHSVCRKIDRVTTTAPFADFAILIRKPLSEKTVAANVLKYGTGGINVDGCRVGTRDFIGRKSTEGGAQAEGWGTKNRNTDGSPLGRFPANLVLSHNEDCKMVGMKDVKASRKNADVNVTEQETKFGQVKCNEITTLYGNGDGTETVQAWHCSPACAVAMLDEQSGHLKSGGTGGGGKTFHGAKYDQPKEKKMPPNEGGASRFFYCAKASKTDRGADNKHPTVKSTKLMSYLCRLVTPVGGTVLDPFMGSGSTGVAALAEGFQFFGCEQDPEHAATAERRFAHG